MPSSEKANAHMLQSSTTFSPETAMMCSRPLRGSRRSSACVDALVVAEDHALQHLAHGRVHAGAQMRAGGQTQAVDGALERRRGGRSRAGRRSGPRA